MLDLFTINSSEPNKKERDFNHDRFRLHYDSSNAIFIRYGFIAALIGNISFQGFFILTERLNANLALYITLIGFIYNCISIVCTFIPALRKYLQGLVALSLILGAILSIIVVHITGAHILRGLVAIIGIGIIGLFIQRLRFWYAVLSVLSQTAMYHFYLFYLGKADDPYIVFGQILIWTYASQAIVASWLAERVHRKTFQARSNTTRERKQADALLRNTLPASVMAELKKNKTVQPRHYESATVLFTDFAGFTKIAADLPPEELVSELDQCFSYFDFVMGRYNIEKIKTIGDAYLGAGGIPESNRTHAIDCVMAALEIKAIMERIKMIKTDLGLPYWELRIGIHTGSLITGVIGEHRFSYDIWGETVGLAKHAEAFGDPGKICITEETSAQVQDFFDIEAAPGNNTDKTTDSIIKHFYVNSIKQNLSRNGEGVTPNQEFLDKLAAL